MPRTRSQRTVWALRLVGWGLGLWGMLLLGDDFVGANQHDNLEGVLLILAGIGTLLFARRRESLQRRYRESEDKSEPEPAEEPSQNSA